MGKIDKEQPINHGSQDIQLPSYNNPITEVIKQQPSLEALFLENVNPVDLLDKRHRTLGIPTDNEIEYRFGTNGEKKFFDNYSRRPTTDIDTINARGEFFDILTDGEKLNLNQLYTLKNNAYEIYRSLKFLKKIPEEESYSSGKRRTNMEIISQNTQITPEIIDNPENSELRMSAGMLEIINTLRNIKPALEDIPKLTTRLSKINHPLFPLLATKIDEIYQQIEIKSSGEFLTQYREDPEILGQVLKLARNIKETIEPLGALIALAINFKKEKHAIPTFDSNRPVTYQNGWSGKRVKRGFSFQQTLNNAPEDKPIVFLTGEQMAGKSFQQEVFQQMVSMGQTFKRIPAESGNLEIYHGLYYLEHALSGNGLFSAFGEDINNLLEVIDKLENQTEPVLIQLDEVGNSTDAKGQVIVVLSFLYYFLEQSNVKVIIAHHNNILIEIVSKNNDIALHHLATTEDEKYKLKQGTQEFDYLGEMEKHGMTEEIIQTAQEYLDGKYPQISVPKINRPPIKEYSKDQREKAKKQSSSFRNLMPYADELVMNGDFVSWKYENQNYACCDLQGCNEGIPEYDQFFLTNTSFIDNILKTDSKIDTKPISMMFLADKLNTIEEKLERGKMYEALMKSNLDELFATVKDLKNVVWAFANLNETFEYFEEFNKYLFSKTMECIDNFKMRNLVEEENPGMYTHSILYQNHFQILQMIIDFNIELGSLTEGDVARYFEEIDEIKNEYIRLKAREKVKDSLEGKRINYADDFEQFSQEVINPLIKKYSGSKEINTSETLNNAIDNCDEKFQKIIKKMRNNLSDKISNKSLFDIDNQALIPILKRYQKFWGWEESICPPEQILFIQLISSLLSQEDFFDKLSKSLREVDSVHLHQIANYLDDIWAKIIPKDCKTGQGVLQKLKKKKEAEKEEDLFDFEDYDIWDYEITNRLQKELNKVDNILKLAQLFKQRNACRVKFNTTGEIRIKNPQNLKFDGDGEKKNTIFMPNDQHIFTLSGSNMSGKTHTLDQTKFAILLANSCGMAFADEADIPDIKRTIDMKRVKARTELGLSPGGTDCKYWLEVFSELKKSDGDIVLFGDETWKTIDNEPGDAFTYATMQKAVGENCRVFLAYHGEDFIRNLSDKNPDLVSVHHLKTNISRDDEDKIQVDFTRKLTDGYAPSNALEIMEFLGVPDEIMKYARQIKNTLN